MPRKSNFVVVQKMNFVIFGSRFVFEAPRCGHCFSGLKGSVGMSKVFSVSFYSSSNHCEDKCPLGGLQISEKRQKWPSI